MNTITVEPIDIIHAEYTRHIGLCDSEHCPVAMALKRIGVVAPMVGRDRIFYTLDSARQSQAIPHSLYIEIKSWDHGHGFTPGTYNLDTNL